MTGEVALTGRLVCATDAEAATVAAHVNDHIRLTRAEPGCRAFAITPTADPRVWTVSERFADTDALAAHQARTAGSAWALATAEIARVWDDAP